MNYLIEHFVKEYQHHQEALGSFGRLALEVYIAYLLERIIEHFHEAIRKFLGMRVGKFKYCLEKMTAEVIPGILSTIKKVLASLLKTANRLFEKVKTPIRRIMRKKQNQQD